MAGILILGGARSGKSAYALDLGTSFLGEDEKGLFLATARPTDPEMEQRITAHRRQRGPQWETWEVPEELEQAVEEQPGWARVTVVDCITLWVANLLEAGLSDAGLFQRAERLAQAASAARRPVILVSNEVGMGLVPEHPLGRRFRDAAGRVNQLLASACDQVVLVVAGLPMAIKEKEL